MKNIKLLLTVTIIIIATVLAVVGWVILPDTLVVQITLSGEVGNTLPKMAGLIVPFFISVAFAVMYYLHDIKKHLFISVIGLSLFIVTFFMNLL